MSDVELPTNHVGDENGQRLGGSTCGANRACEMNRNELRAIDVVEQANLTDAFQRGHKNGLGQHRKTDTKTNIDGFLQIITRISEPARHRLCNDDRRGFTVVLFQQVANVVGDLVTFEVFDKEFFRSPGQVGGSRDFHPVLVVKSLLAGMFSDAIRIIRSLVEPLMVRRHLTLQTLNVNANEGIFCPQIHALVRLAHGRSDSVHADPLSSPR